METYYLLRSQTDGRYLAALLEERGSGYLLIFQEHADALSYINTHAQDAANRFAVESSTRSRLGELIKRWGFSGVGIVSDPLIPKIEFLKHTSGNP
ncbi:MAG: hypothetical protein AAF378_04730 [Cyanobacteria bacterium P01_A01_bin.84]